MGGGRGEGEAEGHSSAWHSLVLDFVACRRQSPPHVRLANRSMSAAEKTYTTGYTVCLLQNAGRAKPQAQVLYCTIQYLYLVLRYGYFVLLLLVGTVSYLVH